MPTCRRSRAWPRALDNGRPGASGFRPAASTASWSSTKRVSAIRVSGTVHGEGLPWIAAGAVDQIQRGDADGVGSGRRRQPQGDVVRAVRRRCRRRRLPPCEAADDAQQGGRRGARGDGPSAYRGCARTCGLGSVGPLAARTVRALRDGTATGVAPGQDLHQAEFTRHALAVAEHGVGAAHSSHSFPALNYATLYGGWRCPSHKTSSWAGARRAADAHLPLDRPSPPLLLSDLPDRPLTVTCPAGPGLPLPADGATGADQAFAAPTPPRRAGRA